MFDRLDITVINLDRRPDRMEHIHKHAPFSYNPQILSKNNDNNDNNHPTNDPRGSYRRFSAIDGNNLSTYYKSNPEFRDLLNTVRNQPRVLGEVGCSLSHFSLWNSHATNPNSDYLLVFEDDVVFSHNSHERLSATMRDIISIEHKPIDCIGVDTINDDDENAWDCIYIGGQWTPDYAIDSNNSYFKYQATTFKSIDTYYNKVYSRPGCETKTLYRRKNRNTAAIHGDKNIWYTPLFRTAGAYLVSKRGARRLLEAIETDTALFMKTPLDMWILEMDFRGYINVFDSFPHPFYQAGFEMVKEQCHIANDIHRTKYDNVICE
jgi:GR25 family glycosyltransferase involved in LPS biosynthesis